MKLNIWGNCSVCPPCHRLGDNQIEYIQMVCIRIYDLQKVGQYQSYNIPRICHWTALWWWKNSGFISNRFVQSTHQWGQPNIWPWKWRSKTSRILMKIGWRRYLVNVHMLHKLALLGPAVCSQYTTVAGGMPANVKINVKAARPVPDGEMFTLSARRSMRRRASFPVPIRYACQFISFFQYIIIRD